MSGYQGNAWFPPFLWDHFSAFSPLLSLLCPPQWLFCHSSDMPSLFLPQKLSTCYSSAWTTIHLPYGLLPHLLKIFQLLSLYLKLQRPCFFQTFCHSSLLYCLHNIDDYIKSLMFCLSIHFLFLFRLSTLWGQLFCFFYFLLYPQPPSSEAW